MTQLKGAGPPPNKGKTYPPEVLTPDEVRALIITCSATSSIGIRNRALITLLYRTGLRISEALGRGTRRGRSGSTTGPSR